MRVVFVGAGVQENARINKADGEKTGSHGAEIQVEIVHINENRTRLRGGQEKQPWAWQPCWC